MNIFFVLPRFVLFVIKSLMFENNVIKYHNRGLIKILDRLNYLLLKNSMNAKYYLDHFSLIKPSILVSSFYIDKKEWVPLIVAKAMGVTTIIAINSWDNLSSKSRVPIIPDYFFVWSDHMKDELLLYYPEVDEQKVLICGAPQFDFHINNFFKIDHDKFKLLYGLKPFKKTILYAGVTPGLMPNEHKIIIDILEAINNGEIKGNPNFLLRLHPKDGGERYKKLIKDFLKLNQYLIKVMIKNTLTTLKERIKSQELLIK